MAVFYSLKENTGFPEKKKAFSFLSFLSEKKYRDCKLFFK